MIKISYLQHQSGVSLHGAEVCVCCSAARDCLRSYTPIGDYWCCCFVHNTTPRQTHTTNTPSASLRQLTSTKLQWPNYAHILYIRLSAMTDFKHLALIKMNI